MPRGRGRACGRGRGNSDRGSAWVSETISSDLLSRTESHARPAPIPCAPMVLEVPGRRRITRALLKGVSLSIDEYTAAASANHSNGVKQQRSSRSKKSIEQNVRDVASECERNGHPPPISRGSSTHLVVGGVLHCICNAFLMTSQGTLLECSRCLNWCHPACVGVDHAELRQFKLQKNYICPYCSGEYYHPTADKTTPLMMSSTSDGTTLMAPCGDKGSGCSQGTYKSSAMSSTTSAGKPSNSADATGVACTYTTIPPTIGGCTPPVPHQAPLKLREVPDCSPDDAAHLRSLLESVRHLAHQLGFDIIDLPSDGLSDDDVLQCYDCCADAVRSATFSESYPVYCLREVRSGLHPYVQGTLLRHRGEHKICSIVLSNGMDVYGNLKLTITQLKSALRRGLLTVVGVTACMSECAGITDISDFVHITLSSTHPKYQRRGLAKLLMTVDLLKWALRGRTRAFLNMAIEKHLVDGGTRVEYVSPASSKHLYESFGFMDVFPRHDPVTLKERWTAKEADMGRVMANLHFIPRVMEVASTLKGSYAHQCYPSMKEFGGSATRSGVSPRSKRGGSLSLGMANGDFSVGEPDEKRRSRKRSTSADSCQDHMAPTRKLSLSHNSARTYS